jgi:hypothetical protein
MLRVVMIAGLEAVTPSGDYALIIVRMDYTSPAELILVL